MKEQTNFNRKFQSEAQVRYQEFLNRKKTQEDKPSRLQNFHRVEAEFTAFLMRFAGMMHLSVSAPEVQQLVALWQLYITENFYTCSDDILDEIRILYLEDERFRTNLNKIAPGLADFVSQAIRVYLENKHYYDK